MFLGEHQHTIDPKGRVVLPSRFRDDLAKGCFITKGQDHCLFVFTPKQWEQEVERIRSLPRTDRRLRNYARVFFAGAIDQKVFNPFFHDSKLTMPPKVVDTKPGGAKQRKAR